MNRMPTLEDWENLVKKQLKSDDIYQILLKENLEDIAVKPFYQEASGETFFLPKVAESTHLVSRYDEKADDNVLAFLLKENVENLSGKCLFIDNMDLAEHLSPVEENKYFSLIDVFARGDEKCIDEQLGKELLGKAFDRQMAVDVSLHQNAGASIIQQLGFALLKAKELAEAFGPEVLKTLVFRVAIGGNYFFEIAKIRALKLLFNQLSKEYSFDDIPFIFAETSERNKSKFDPENNLIRATLELSAAMIGGADAVYSHSYRVKNSNALADEISFKQQLVLAYESILNVFDDAAGGSYFVEDITQQFAAKAWQLFLRIENEGGYCAGISSGEIPQMIFEQAVKEQSWVNAGKISLVGVNIFPKRETTKDAEEVYDPKVIKKVRFSELFED